MAKKAPKAWANDYGYKLDCCNFSYTRFTEEGIIRNKDDNNKLFWSLQDGLLSSPISTKGEEGYL
jgi:hypothetical protein